MLQSLHVPSSIRRDVVCRAEQVEYVMMATRSIRAVRWCCSEREEGGKQNSRPTRIRDTLTHSVNFADHEIWCEN